VTWSP